MPARFQRFVDRQFPHALIKRRNPLFEFESKHEKSFRSRSQLKRDSALILLIAVISSIPVAMLIYGGGGIVSGITVNIIVMLTVGVSLGADVYYMMLTTDGISRYSISGHLDLLKLTSMKQPAILKAIYAVFQIRVWYMMMVEMAIRVLGAFLILFPVIWTLSPNFQNLNNAELDISNITELMCTIGFLLMIVLIIGLVGTVVVGYIVEPLWRMRALVALGLSISARIENPAFSIIAGFLSAFAIRILELIIIVSLMFFPPFAPFVISGLYEAVNTRSLSYALRYAFSPE
jgi:hypothetical protein